MTRNQTLQKHEPQQKLQELLQQELELQQDMEDLKQNLPKKFLDKVQLDMILLLELHMLQMELKSLLKLQLPQPQHQDIEQILQDKVQK